MFQQIKNKIMQPGDKNRRIGWIDALRGFTMILVVFYHVEIFSLGIGPDYGVNAIVKLLHLPLFFFVSGFVAYRPQGSWSLADCGASLLKKVRVLLVPMLFFGLLYATTCFAGKSGHTPAESLAIFFNHSEKIGYWFTEALLGMFVIYYAFSFLLRRFKPTVFLGALAAVSLMLYCLTLRSVTQYEHIAVARWLCMYNIFLYFQFFVFGNIVSHYREKVFKALDNPYVIGAILLLLLLAITVYINRKDVQGLYIHTYASKLLAEAIRYLGIVSVTAVFRHYERFFSSETTIGRGLQYIGRRTLDVYLIHWFFFPAIPMVGAFFVAGGNFTLEVTTVVLLSLLVILFSLIMSNVIRISPFLAYWLLGERKEKTQRSLC